MVIFYSDLDPLIQRRTVSSQTEPTFPVMKIRVSPSLCLSPRVPSIIYGRTLPGAITSESVDAQRKAGDYGYSQIVTPIPMPLRIVYRYQLVVCSQRERLISLNTGRVLRRKRFTVGAAEALYKDMLGYLGSAQLSIDCGNLENLFQAHDLQRTTVPPLYRRPLPRSHRGRHRRKTAHESFRRGAT